MHNGDTSVTRHSQVEAGYAVTVSRTARSVNDLRPMPGARFLQSLRWWGTTAGGRPAFLILNDGDSKP